MKELTPKYITNSESIILSSYCLPKKLRDVVVAIPHAFVVLYNKDNPAQILLRLNNNTKNFSLIGGKLYNKERAWDGAVRETMEESGIDISACKKERIGFLKNGHLYWHLKKVEEHGYLVPDDARITLQMLSITLANSPVYAVGISFKNIPKEHDGRKLCIIDVNTIESKQSKLKKYLKKIINQWKERISE